jgi:transposase-like protein
MRCERCLASTSVEKHVVDGFSGFLCERCRSEWARLTADRTADGTDVR